MGKGNSATRAALQMLDTWYNTNKDRNGRIGALTSLINEAAADRGRSRVTMYSPMSPGATPQSWDGVKDRLPHRLGTSQPSMMDLFDLYEASPQARQADPQKYVGWAFLHAMEIDTCPYVVMIVEGPYHGWIREIFFVYVNMDLGNNTVTNYVPIVKFNYDYPNRRFVLQQIDRTADVAAHLTYHP